MLEACFVMVIGQGSESGFYSVMLFQLLYKWVRDDIFRVVYQSSSCHLYNFNIVACLPTMVPGRRKNNGHCSKMSLCLMPVLFRNLCKPCYLERSQALVEFCNKVFKALIHRAIVRGNRYSNIAFRLQIAVEFWSIERLRSVLLSQTFEEI